MNTKTLISVIIPTYNREHYIAEAIDSVLAQKLPSNFNLEVIIADDGSSDKTCDIVGGYSNRIKLIKLSHSGNPAVPRNAALEVAKGELIAFQDSDDVWGAYKLAEQLKVFNDRMVVLCYSNAAIINADGQQTGKTVVATSALKQGETFSGLLADNVISTLTVVARRSVLEAAGSFNESDDLKGVEDYELWLRLATKYPRGIKAINKKLAFYRQHDQNVSAGDTLQAIERIQKVYDSLGKTDLSARQRSQLEIAHTKIQQNWGRLHDEMYPDKRPKLSVVMSVYNGAEHVRGTVTRILEQTFKNFEFIIIDDGSTDDSAEIIQSFKDSRIRLIRQSNHGLVQSLNLGFKLARGKYIARQDADDISLPERFKKEVALLDKDPRLGLVGTFFTYIDEDTLEPGLTICMPTKSLDIKRALYITNPIGHGTAMIRREVFENTALYTDKYGPTEDFELWRRIADNWELAIIPESLYHYLLNTKSISHTKGKVQHANTSKIIDEQWAKPFFKKSIRAIIRDGRYYKGLDSSFADLIFDQYAAHQIDIAKGLFERGAIIPASSTAFAAASLKPRSLPLFIKPALRAIMRILKIK